MRLTQVEEQFGRTAEAYLSSPTHATGPDLDALVAELALTGRERILDVGTGAGHTARRLASRAAHVVALDPTAPMLAVARRATSSANITFVRARAEALPFPAGAFDATVTRLAAHHFADVAQACREMARVTRHGGRVVVIDNYAPDDPALDRFINELETIRDPSHVREPRRGEWEAMLDAAGLAARVVLSDAIRLETEPWLARSQTPPDRATEARRRLATASPEAVRAFAIDEQSFSTHRIVLSGTRR